MFNLLFLKTFLGEKDSSKVPVCPSLNFQDSPKRVNVRLTILGHKYTTAGHTSQCVRMHEPQGPWLTC